MAGIYRLSFVGLLLVGPGLPAEKKLELKNLPPAVQQIIRHQAKDSQIKSITQETEQGQTQYEVETIKDGKHRDFNVNTHGRLLEIEDEAVLESIPAVAKAAITSKAAGGKLGKVEIVTKGGATLYEASYTTRNGKKHEVRVTPDGTEVKE